MDGPLAGKTALVTGATRGIGRAIAERLFADGATVIGTGRLPGGDVPEGVEFRAADLADMAAAQTFAKEVEVMAPDILINNAGINSPSPFADIDAGDFTAIQQVNVTAPFLLCRAALPGMKGRGWGRIVNIASVWSKIAKEGRASYSTSKFALDGLTKALAAEVTEFGILANCVSPGIIDTEMTRNALDDEQLRALVDQVPAKRLGQPAEIAAVVAWLAGPENTFISGQNIAVDGGLTRV